MQVLGLEGIAIGIGPGIQTEPQIMGDRLGKPGLALLGRPGQAEQQFGEPFSRRQLAVGVQSQPDLGFFEFTEIAIGRVQLRLQLFAPGYGFRPLVRACCLG